MPTNKRKRRIRLSYIGGRRPSLLPKVYNENIERPVKINEDCDVELPTDSQPHVSITDQVVKNHQTNDFVIKEKQTKKNGFSVQKAYKDLKEKCDDKEYQIFETHQLSKKLYEEINKWKDFISTQQQQKLDFLTLEKNMVIPQDVKSFVSLDLIREQNEIQDLTNLKCHQIYMISKLECKLTLLKETIVKDLTSKQEELHVLGVKSETPRHLIKTILQGKK